MQSNFDRSLSAVLKHEGGYVDHPKDPGGATNLGITHKTLAAWRKVTPWWKLDKSEVKNLSRVEAAAIYRKNYWDAIRGDELPSGVDYAVFDYAVNSGPVRAAKALQRIVKATVDGHIGAQTLAAANEYDEAGVITALCDGRLAWLKTLSTWATFGKGWASRVNGVRKMALLMAAAGAAEPTEAPDDPTAPETPASEAPSAPDRSLANGVSWGRIGIAVAIVAALGWAAYRFLT